MALLDKVKAQASQAVQKAQEAGKAGQARLEDVQAKRQVDRLLRQLGAAVYAERTGQQPVDEAATTQLVEQIKALQAAHGDGVVDPAGADEE